MTDVQAASAPRGGSRKLATRERLLAALRARLDNGSDAVRVADIVEIAGVSQGTFYLHFGGIEDAVRIVAVEMCDEAVERLRSVDVDDHDLLGMAVGLLETYADVLEDQADRWSALRRTAGSPQDLDAAAAQRHVRVAAMLSDLLGRPGGLVSGEQAALRTASAIVAMVEQTVALWRQHAATGEADPLYATPAVTKAVLAAVVRSLWGDADALTQVAPAEAADQLLGDAPDARIALIAGARRITYGELRDRVRRAAAWLHASGLRTGDRLALLLHNGVAAIELGLAGRYLGLVVVPMNTYWGIEEVQRTLQHCEATALAFDEEARGIINSLEPEMARGIHRLPIGAIGDEQRYEREIARYSPSDAPPPSSSSTTLWYTSGTTRDAKGVLRDESAEERRRHLAFLSDLFGVTSDDMCLVAGPLHHAAHYLLANMALTRGASLVVMVRFGAEDFLRLVEEHRATRTMLVPTMLYRLLRLPESVLEGYEVTSLESMIHTAAPCPADLKRAAIDRFGPILDEFYGATEMGGTYVGAEEWLAHPGTVGRPWSPETQVAILSEDGRREPPDYLGRVALLDPRRAPFRYHKDPEHTAAVMHDGMFLTGDLGWLDEDGYLYLAEREGDVIISGGVNVYPSEIEAILNSQSGVADSAVVGLPDPEWGERIVAFIEPRPGATVDVPLLRDAVRRSLAHYKCPRDWQVVDRLPRDEAGKLRRRELRPHNAAS